MAMKKKEIIIENDNPTQLELIITNHQSDGVYRYQPEPEDTVKLIIISEGGEQVTEFTADNSDPEYVFVDIDTTGIPEGKYRYQIIVELAADDETYIINEETPLIIRR